MIGAAEADVIAEASAEDSAAEADVIGRVDKCFMPSAAIAEKTVKFRFSLLAASLYIAATVLKKWAGEINPREDLTTEGLEDPALNPEMMTGGKIMKNSMS